MGNCFVIQPFDKGAYDKRYEDVIVPAITKAGLKDYRVDRDPTSRVLIDSIEQGIREADACIADVTTNNPNVWYELGFCIANGKPLVMICNSRDRQGEYPFDIRHRPVISYAPDAPRDFENLQNEMTTRLQALVETSTRVQTMASMASSQTISGLSPHEMAAICIIMENQVGLDQTIPGTEVQNAMVSKGFTKLAAVLSLRQLESRALIEGVNEQVGEWEYCASYRATPTGFEWILRNQDQIDLRDSRTMGKQPKAKPISDHDARF